MKTATIVSVNVHASDPASYKAEFKARGGCQWITVEPVAFHFRGPEDFEVFATTMQIALKKGAEHFCGRLHADGDKEENDL